MDVSKLVFDGITIKLASSDLDIDRLLDSIKKLGTRKGFIQVFDPKSIINSTHIIGSYANALVAFRGKTNKTNSMAMEMMLFAGMTDQIGEAIKRVGAKSSSDFIVFSSSKAILRRARGFIRVKSDFRPSVTHITKTAKSFGISPKANKGIDAMILEKISISRLNSR